MPSVSTLGNIGGLLASLVAFTILAVGYTLVADKKPMRSDYVMYMTLFNVAILVGVVVAIVYTKEREIPIQ